MPLLARSISAASTPTVLSSAELKSTNGALARVGTLPSPDRCMAPDIAWPIVSKPTRVAYGPSEPKVELVARMIRGLIAEMVS